MLGACGLSVAGGCSCLVCCLCCWYLNTKLWRHPDPTDMGRSGVVGKARAQSALNHLLSRKGSAPLRLHLVPAAPFGELSPATCIPTVHGRVIFPSPHGYSAISVIAELVVTAQVWHSTLTVVPQLMLDPLSSTTQFGPKPSALLYGSPQSPGLSEQLQLQQRWAPCHQQHPRPSSG